MSAQPASLWDDLKSRGIIYQTTSDDLQTHLNQPIVLYCGFDPSADTLHIGSLLPLVTLRRFQNAGHTPIVIVGGATGMIGDPSFKASERALLTESQVQANIEGIKKSILQILDFSPERKNAAKIINNADFYTSMNPLVFLREIGKHFSVNQMEQKDSVRARMEDRAQGISFTEFSYALLQSYDFYRLLEDQNCTLQIGASDQWGNITSGTDFIRKKDAYMGRQPRQPFGLTHPLITRKDGKKFGKTEEGTVWLSADRTSPYQLYQFFVNASDEEAILWLKYLTFFTLPEIEMIAREHAVNPSLGLAQKKLAEAIVELVHGTDAAKSAIQTSKALFSKGEVNDEILIELASSAPSTTVDHVDIALIDALEKSGLCPSKGMARKEITAGGVYVNQHRITDVAFRLTEKDFIRGEIVLLRRGKKTFHVLRRMRS